MADISGYEEWTTEEIIDSLMGDEVPPHDLEGIHGALILLARKIGRLEDELRDLRDEVRGE